VTYLRNVKYVFAYFREDITAEFVLQSPGALVGRSEEKANSISGS
jgi:hypothetical protein